MMRQKRSGQTKRQQKKPVRQSDSQSPERDHEWPENIDVMYGRVAEAWGKCDDIRFRWIQVGGRKAFIVCIYTLIGKELLQEGLLEPLTTFDKSDKSIEDLEQALRTVSLKPVKNLEEINVAIGSGEAVLCVDGWDRGLAMDLMDFQGRAVEKAASESVVRGPQEAFTESLEKNLALYRRRLKSPNAKVEYMTLGRVSKTTIALVYVQGIVKPGLVEECRERLRRIDVDSVLDAGYIEEMIDDAPLSPFPTIEYTERPERLAAEILQGRIGILVDGSPNALLAPAIFVHFLQSAEEYFERYTMATAVRLLRHFFFWLALLLPATYVALLSYHQEMIPTTLLITLISTHEQIPFPSVVEALIMEITFEALREAGLRLPRAVGQSVSIVGALVIGEAAVNAGIVTPAMVIIVALTGIASFAIPSYNIAISLRILRFPVLLLAGVLGLYGIIIAALILWIHLASLRSFGVPYLSPMAPLIWSDLKDVFVRAPWWQMRRRPKTLEPLDLVRSAEVTRPVPGQPGED